MIELVLAMGGILAAWLLAGAVFIGIGRGVAALCAADSPSLSLARAFWWGWAATLAFLQIWHLLLPVDGRATAMVVAAGAIGWLSTARRGFGLVWKQPLQGRSYVTWAAMVLTAIFVANLALGTPQNYDTGLYHLQAVRWNSHFAIVPGLGNLHGRLAFNNPSLLYASLLDVGPPWTGRSHHLASGLLALAVLLPLMMQRDKFLLLLLPATVLFSYKQVTSYSPDLVMFLLGVVVTADLWELLADRGDEPQRRWQGLFGIVLVSSVGAVVKLSFLPMAVATIAVACAFGGLRTLPLSRKAILAILPITILGVWAARGAIMSGYPAYPQTWLAADVEWRVSPEQAQRDLDEVRVWARDRDAPADEVLQGGHWIAAWAARQFRDVLKVTLPLIILCAATVAAWRLRRASAQNGFDRRWWVLAPSLATVAFVLIAAPDLSRFAGASLWILAAAATTLLLDDLVGTAPMRTATHWARIVAAATAVILAIAVVKAARYLNGPSDAGAFRPVPTARLAPRTTESGLVVHVPYRLPGDEVRGDQAWDAPLPSTPQFNPRLTPRRADDLGSGFVAPEGP
jgi:hypothetical protein